MDRKPYDARFESIRLQYNLWVPAWKEIKKFELPLNGKFIGDQPNIGKKIDHTELLDSAATQAINTSAAGFAAHLTSPSQPWMALGLRNKELARSKNVKWWLGEVGDRILSTFADSNFYPHLGPLYKEFLGFNTIAGLIEEDRQSVIRCVNFTIGEYMLGLGADGRPDTFCREYDVQVGPLVARFGLENVCDSTKKLYNDGEFDKWIKCRHMVAPNVNRQTGKLDNKNMPWISLYWEISASTEKNLSESGYLAFPFHIGFWEVLSGDVYAKGTGWEALGGSKMLQKQVSEWLIAVETVNKPPMQGDAEADIDTVPGGFTPTSLEHPDGGIKPAYQIRPDLMAMQSAIAQTKKDIQATFYADRFLMLESIERGMTAREVYERTMENMRAVGPVVVKIQEFLDQAIRRTFTIMFNAGLFPEIPQELAGQAINIEYISLMAQAQKSVRTQAIQEHLLAVGEMAKLNSEVVDVVDWDKSAILDGELRGIPAGVDRTQDEIAAIRQDRAKQRAAAQKAQALQTTIAGAQALSKTKMGEGNALDRVVEAAGGQPAAGQ